MSKIKWTGLLPQLLFWIIITLLFLYERRYLIDKAGLPSFLACVTVRVAMLMGLAYLNLNIFLPRFFAKGKLWLFALFLIASIAVYVALQGAYDMFLFGFVIGDIRHRGFWYNIPYNMVTSGWYLVITVCFKITLDWFQQKNAAPLAIENEPQIAAETPEYIYFKTGTKTVKIRMADITYVKGLKDYSIIYTPSDKVITKGTLKYIESILPDGDFLRIHKSYIIAKNKIIAVERTKVLLQSLVSIPVGRNFQGRLEGF
nr:LytTR family DNA-binding domain-containing protein [uncultured Mucilaginibacter sp.]